MQILFLYSLHVCIFITPILEDYYLCSNSHQPWGVRLTPAAVVGGRYFQMTPRRLVMGSNHCWLNWGKMDIYVYIYICFSSWLGLNHPFEKYDRQIGSFPQVGVKIKNVWNHHLVFIIWIWIKMVKICQDPQVFITNCIFQNLSYLTKIFRMFCS